MGLFAAASANAELITFDYTAKVSMAVRIPKNGGAMENLPSLSFNGTRMALGDSIRGSFTIDLDTPVQMYYPVEGASSSYIKYGNPDAMVSKSLITMSVDRTGYSFAPTPSGRRIRLDA